MACHNWGDLSDSHLTGKASTGLLLVGMGTGITHVRPEFVVGTAGSSPWGRAPNQTNLAQSLPNFSSFFQCSTITEIPACSAATSAQITAPTP